MRIVTKGDLKLTSLRCFKHPVVLPQSNKAHAELYILSNSCIDLLVSPSVTRENHPKKFELVNLLQHIAGHS